MHFQYIIRNDNDKTKKRRAKLWIHRKNPRYHFSSFRLIDRISLFIWNINFYDEIKSDRFQIDDFARSSARTFSTN